MHAQVGGGLTVQDKISTDKVVMLVTWLCKVGGSIPLVTYIHSPHSITLSPHS